VREGAPAFFASLTGIQTGFDISIDLANCVELDTGHVLESDAPESDVAARPSGAVIYGRSIHRSSALELWPPATRELFDHCDLESS
jgi:hypothetical protein